jgi:DNA replication protein DnaC
MPLRLRGYRLDGSPHEELAGRIRAWIAGRPWREGRNLILIGPTGTGKTALAVGAMRLALELGERVELVNVPDWLQRQRPGGDGFGMPGEGAPLLVLDDVGAEKSSVWVRERLYCLINGRYEWRLSTIVTSNLTDVDGLSAAIGERAVSRLCEEALILAVAGRDLRFAEDGAAR